MPTFYMMFWSMIMIIALGVWRLRNWGQVLVVGITTVFVLILSQSLFIQLSISASLDPSHVLTNSGDFLVRGPLGWLALLVMDSYFSGSVWVVGL